MAYRKKADYILIERPDIVIIPECENPERLKFGLSTPKPNDIYWHGENSNKGLGIFSYSNYRFKLLECFHPALKTVLPLSVTGGNFDFILFAIWANNKDDKDGHYIEQVWKAIHYYENLLKNEKVLIAGDFNSNTIWDRTHRHGNHSAVVEKLANIGIHSTYHHYFKQTQGKEEHPTLFMYRHKDKPYHIDYCFASTDFIDKLINVEVGNYEEWSPYSDHSPLTVTFDI